MQRQTYRHGLGICCHGLKGTQMHTTVVGRRGTPSFMGTCERSKSQQRHFPQGSHASLRHKNWVKGKIVLTAGQREPEGGDWDSCTRTPKAVILLTVPTGPIKGENGGAVSARESRYLQDGGATRGVNWRCTNISCYLSLNGNLRGGTR